jgi:rod shape-determining protein MreC
LLGIASGRSGSDLLRLDVESGDTRVKRGDLVVTAGTEPSRYPAGIPVGRVASVSKAPGALEPSILLKPVVDFRRLEFVRVLQWPLARGSG